MLPEGYSLKVRRRCRSLGCPPGVGKVVVGDNRQGARRPAAQLLHPLLWNAAFDIDQILGAWLTGPQQPAPSPP